MIPMLLKIAVPGKNRKPVRLYLPLILIWILLLPFFVLAVLLLLIAAGLSWFSGHGRMILYMIPAAGSLLWNLGGLQIAVQNRETNIYMVFI